MSDLRGYSYATVLSIQAADPTLPGVQLGLLCVAQMSPVHSVAKQCGVSRQTVYSWFTGRFRPSKEKELLILAMIEDLKKVRV